MTVGITLNSPAGSFPSVGRYSYSTAAGGSVFISGQLLAIFDDGKKADASFEDRTRLVFKNIDACLAGAGVSRQHLVSVHVYVADMNQWPTLNEIYGEWTGDFRSSRAVAGVAELHYSFALEVKATTLVPQAWRLTTYR